MRTITFMFVVVEMLWAMLYASDSNWRQCAITLILAVLAMYAREVIKEWDK